MCAAQEEERVLQDIRQRTLIYTADGEAIMEKMIWILRPDGEGRRGEIPGRGNSMCCDA